MQELYTNQMALALVSEKLESIIERTAPRHYLSDNAPKSRVELMKWAQEHFITDPIPILPVKPSKSMFSDLKINYALRAWYDALTIKFNYDFIGIAERLLKEAKYLGASEKDCKVLEYDLVYRVMLQRLHDITINNQRKFVLHCMSGLDPLEYEGE